MYRDRQKAKTAPTDDPNMHEQRAARTPGPMPIAMVKE